MRIKNITPATISVDVWGRHIEMASGWGVSDAELAGGKDAIQYIAFKLQGQVEIYDDNNVLMEFIHCPLCGNEVKVVTAPAPSKIHTIEIEKKIEQPITAEIKVKKVKSRVKSKK